MISHWFRERYTGTDSTLRAIYGTPADDSVRAAKRKSQATGHPPKSASK
ncbi:MAG: hypothetical protein HYR73_07165 [Candidatus Eisenbacteria bacterium]|nr:hypothetical protein [Candidatus Eisenbacteria bacterium]